jgi:hypothetical protein
MYRNWKVRNQPFQEHRQWIVVTGGCKKTACLLGRTILLPFQRMNEGLLLSAQGEPIMPVWIVSSHFLN